MRRIWGQSTTLTKDMYLDNTTRARTLESLRVEADRKARDSGYTPLVDGSFFVSATPFDLDDDGTTHVTTLDTAPYVRLTVEITCEGTHAPNR
jgi:hypothetical protein